MNKPYHIALFTDVFIPGQGGTETSINQQRKSLEALGHTVTIITPKYTELAKESWYIGLPFVYSFFDGQWHHSFTPGPHFSETKLIQTLKERGVTHIHIQTEFSVGALGRRVAKKMNLPYVYTSHTLLWIQAALMPRSQQLLAYYGARLFLEPSVGSLKPLTKEAAETRLSWLMRRLIYTYTHDAHTTVFPSQHFRKTVLSWSDTITPESCVAIANPKTATTQPQPLPDVPTFVFVGRLSREKRVDVFLEACRTAAKQTKTPFKVHIVGRGFFQDMVQKQANTYDWLTYTSHIPNEAIHTVYDTSSVVVLPSYHFDNQPMVIAEAIVHGRGVVTCDPKLKEYLDYGAGICTDTPDAVSIAATLTRLAESSQLVKQLSDNAIETIPHYTAEVIAKKIESVYSR